MMTIKTPALQWQRARGFEVLIGFSHPSYCVFARRKRTSGWERGGQYVNDRNTDSGPQDSSLVSYMYARRTAETMDKTAILEEILITSISCDTYHTHWSPTIRTQNSQSVVPPQMPLANANLESAFHWPQQPSSGFSNQLQFHSIPRSASHEQDIRKPSVERSGR